MKLQTYVKCRDSKIYVLLLISTTIDKAMIGGECDNHNATNCRRVSHSGSDADFGF